MLVAAALLLLQAPAPTVGDTVWVRHAVRLPAGYTARALDWSGNDTVQLLGPPLLRVRGDSAVVRYPVVAWRPGHWTVLVPAPVLISPAGGADSLPPLPVTITVASVLPDRPPGTLTPAPAAEPVARATVSVRPLLGFAGGAIILLLPLHWWWRRRGKPIPEPAAGPPASVPVDRWAGAGETRTVLALAAARAREALARDPDATAAARALLAEADQVRFAPVPGEQALALYRRAQALSPRPGSGRVSGPVPGRDSR